MTVIFRRLFRTAVFSRFSKMAIATSNFMNKFYKGGFTPAFTVSLLKEFLTLVRDYVYETKKLQEKLVEKYIWRRNMKSFSNETLNFFFRKFCLSYILDLTKTVWNLRILVPKFTKNWRTMYLWIYCFAPVISLTYIKYTLLNSSKLLAYFFHIRLFETLI